MRTCKLLQDTELDTSLVVLKREWVHLKLRFFGLKLSSQVQLKSSKSSRISTFSTMKFNKLFHSGLNFFLLMLKIFISLKFSESCESIFTVTFRLYTCIPERNIKYNVTMTQCWKLIIWVFPASSSKLSWYYDKLSTWGGWKLYKNCRNVSNTFSQWSILLRSPRSRSCAMIKFRSSCSFDIDTSKKKEKRTSKTRKWISQTLNTFVLN